MPGGTRGSKGSVVSRALGSRPDHRAHCARASNDHILPAMTDPKMPALHGREVARSSTRDIDSFLGEARQVAAVVPGRNAARLVFALDATMSRQPTWDVATSVQASMFDAAADIGGLSVQLCYFRGLGECRSSGWVGDPRALRDLMLKIRCQSGNTQIGRVLRHVSEEAGRQPVRALIYVGDAVEEGMDGLCSTAGELGLLGLKAFMFHEGGNPATRAAFSEIARLTGGAAMAFDASAPASLAALLRAVAAYAAGGGAALHRLAAQDGGARRLIAAMPKMG
ncbi:VWA domain-containing protein [uncultured Enterovirga sp.]|uniref:VWA domain-containing protein n=1 Tax=uncultured Enterovirga sp. TaxID=2026352 RepID=UPI0035CC9D15